MKHLSRLLFAACLAMPAVLSAQVTINSPDASDNPGNSYLIFTDLTSNSPAGTANGKTLTVDATGKVILVPDGSGLCSGSTNYVLKYTSATTACTSSIYETAGNYVSIGAGTSPIGKLHVDLTDNTNSNLNCGRFIINNTYTGGTAANAIAIYGQASASQTGCQSIIGVSGRADANSTQLSTGGSFYTQGSGTEHRGVYGEANGSGTNRGFYAKATNTGATTNYGVYSTGSGGSAANYGVYGATSGGGTLNYGIYGSAPVGTCPSGGPCTDAAGYFSGDVYTTRAAYVTSDGKFKQNVKVLSNASEILSKFDVKTFTFDQSNTGMHLPEGLQYGFIAQDVQRIMPSMVKNFISPATSDENGKIVTPETPFLAVSYGTLIPILTAAFQEQQTQIKNLLETVAELRNQKPAIELSQKVKLSDINAITLHQNEPNPFGESTIIKYSIPAGTTAARILFTDLKGNIIQSAKIEAEGDGSLEVYASDLSSGLYTYSLVVDGKVIDSKKMIKQ